MKYKAVIGVRGGYTMTKDQMMECFDRGFTTEGPADAICLVGFSSDGRELSDSVSDVVRFIQAQDNLAVTYAITLPTKAA